jgi:hypothetical protein
MALGEIKQQKGRLMWTIREGIHNLYFSANVIKVTIIRRVNRTNCLLKSIRYIMMVKIMIIYMKMILIITIINYFNLIFLMKSKCTVSLNIPKITIFYSLILILYNTGALITTWK